MNTKDPNFDRYAGIEELEEPGHPNRRRAIRVDEDGIEIYADGELQPVAQLGRDRSTQFAQAGIIDWDEAYRRLDEQRSKFPIRVTVDPSCATIPAAYDPRVQKTALEALGRSVNDAAAGKAEHGFVTSENMWKDGYRIGPIFSSGRQRQIDRELLNRNTPGLVRSIYNGTYPPSLFVHTHPNNQPPSPPGKHDQRVADSIGIPIASIDKDGNLFCVLPRKK